MRCSSSLATQHSIKTRDRIFGQVYVFSSFAKNRGRCVSRNLRSTYTQKVPII